MGVNLSALQNITPLQDSLNLSVITEGNVLENAKEVAISTSGGWIGLLIVFAIFTMVFYTLRRRDGKFLYDSLKSAVWGSGFASMFGIVLLSLGFISNFMHVTYFAMAFVLLVLTTFSVRARFT